MSSQLEDAFNEAVERRTAELRAALEFYANADNYVGGEVGWWANAPGGEHRWCMDFGSIARSALSSTDRPPFFTEQQELALARCEGYEDGIAAASPDERLREALRDANEYLDQIADYSPSEVADAIDSVRAQIKDALAATDSRGKPDGASVPDQTRRIVVYDARCGRGGLDVPVGCTVGEAALLAAEMFGVRVGPNDRPSFGLRGTGLHASDPLPDDEDYELFVIGGTV